MELHKWAIVVMSIVAVLSGEILSIGGLALLALIALYFGLRRLGRWADAVD
jgi:hypothetical protein